MCDSTTRPLRGRHRDGGKWAPLDRFGKLEVDPQRIRGRSTVWRFLSPCVNLVRTQSLEPGTVVSASRRMNTRRNVFLVPGVLRLAIKGAFVKENYRRCCGIDVHKNSVMVCVLA